MVRCKKQKVLESEMAFFSKEKEVQLNCNTYQFVEFRGNGMGTTLWI